MDQDAVKGWTGQATVSRGQEMRGQGAVRHFKPDLVRVGQVQAGPLLRTAGEPGLGSLCCGLGLLYMVLALLAAG